MTRIVKWHEMSNDTKFQMTRNDTWHMTYDTWQMTNKTWQMTHETKFQIAHYTHDTWHMIHDTWGMMYDAWHMTHDDQWLQTETPGITHFGAYIRPPDGHFLVTSALALKLAFCIAFQFLGPCSKNGLKRSKKYTFSNLAYYESDKNMKQNTFPPFWVDVDVEKLSPFWDSGVWSPIFGHLNMGTFGNFGQKSPFSGALNQFQVIKIVTWKNHEIPYSSDKLHKKLRILHLFNKSKFNIHNVDSTCIA